MHSLQPGTAQALIQTGTVSVPLGPFAHNAVADTFQVALEFFHAPQDQKDLNVLPEECGYRARGIEYSASPERPDEIESFTACARVHPGLDELPLPSARALYERMETTLTAFLAIAEELTIEMAEWVSGASWAGQLTGELHRWSRLQLNYSRPSRVGGANIHDVHEDGNLLTLACATAPGLEVRRADGGFTPIPPSLDRVFVMPGEIAWLLSGGEIQPAWHRVLPDPNTTERMALMLFADLNPALCEPWVRTDSNAAVDIGARVLTNDKRFGLKGLTPE